DVTMLVCLFCLLCVCLLTVFFAVCSFLSAFTTSVYTLSLHDALPILPGRTCDLQTAEPALCMIRASLPPATTSPRNISRERSRRSEEHTSELQSRFDLVCRLLLEKKKKKLIEDTQLQVQIEMIIIEKA